MIGGDTSTEVSVRSFCVCAFCANRKWHNDSNSERFFTSIGSRYAQKTWQAS